MNSRTIEILSIAIAVVSGFISYIVVNKFPKARVQFILIVVLGVLFSVIAYLAINYSDFFLSPYFLKRAWIVGLSIIGVIAFFAAGFAFVGYVSGDGRELLYFLAASISFLICLFAFMDARRQIIQQPLGLPVHYAVVGESIQCDTTRGNADITIICHEKHLNSSSLVPVYLNTP